MKKSILASLLLVALIVTNGCKKDDPAPSKGMTAKVAGNAWTADIAVATYSQMMNLTQISGMKGLMAEAIQLNITGNDVGTYTLTGAETDPVIGSYVLDATAEGMYTTIGVNAPIGQIVITEYDKTNKMVSGTFHFEAFNLNNKKISITDGVFTKVALTMAK
jgi:hypothetical protein